MKCWLQNKDKNVKQTFLKVLVKVGMFARLLAVKVGFWMRGWGYGLSRDGVLKQPIGKVFLMSFRLSMSAWISRICRS